MSFHLLMGMLISTRYMHVLMSNLIKKSWTDSIKYAKILENKEFLVYTTFEVTCQKRHPGEKRVDKNSHLPPQLESLQGIRLVT